MGNDKRREVVGQQYGATVRKRLLVYGVAVGVIVLHRHRLPDRSSRASTRSEIALKDTAPWTAGRATQEPPRDVDFKANGPTDTIPEDEIVTASSRRAQPIDSATAARASVIHRDGRSDRRSGSGAGIRQRSDASSTSRVPVPRIAGRRRCPPPRRRSRAPACRRASRAGSRAAAPWIAASVCRLAARRAEQPGEHRDVADQLEHGPQTIRVGLAALDPRRARSPRARRPSATSRARPSPRPAAPPRARARGNRSRRSAPAPRIRAAIRPAASRSRSLRSISRQRLLVHPAPLADPLVLARHPLGVHLGQLLGAALAPVARSAPRSSARRRPPRAGTRSRSRESASSRAGRRRCPGRRGRAGPGPGR